MSRATRLLTLLLALALAAALAGCFGDDDDDDGPTDPPPPTGPTTPDEVMTAFLLTYGEGDLAGYEDLLDEDFRFVCGDGSMVDRATELALTAPLFAGEAGEGGFAFSDVTIEYLQPQGLWEQVEAADPYFGDLDGVLRRAYDVFLSFRVDGQALIYQVQGLVIFYTRADGDGFFWLVGIHELSDVVGKATEQHGWCEIRHLFD
jgi:hypothetical protein